MLNKKSFILLFLSLIIVSLAGCGGEKASFDVPTRSGGAQLVSIVITPTTTKTLTGTTRQLTATGTFSDNTVQDVTTTVTWSSDILAVATVGDDPGSKGQANAIAAGETMITATSGDVSGAVLLHVIEGALVTLLWDAPTTNTDGSPLNPVTELSTYKIYYGLASHMYTAVVSIQNPGTTTISQALELPSGTYYFAVTTVDAAGQESDYSNELMKTI